MNTKSRLLAGVSALAIIVGTSACDRGAREDNSGENTVVLANDVNVVETNVDEPETKDCSDGRSVRTADAPVAC